LLLGDPTATVDAVKIVQQTDHPALLSPLVLELAAILACAALWACDDGGQGDASNPDADADADADVDADADGDGDADADMDATDGGDADERDGDADDGGTPPDGIAGTVTYERRAISPAGLAPPAPVAAAGVGVRLEVAGDEVAATTTDASGTFAFEALAAGTEATLRVVASSDGLVGIDVADFGGSTYAVTTDPFEAVEGTRVDVAIGVADNSGAFAIFHTLHAGLEIAAESFERADPFPRLGARWERGSETPGGTSYLDGTDIYLLGGPTDTDEFDESVVSHELGHFVQTVYPSTTWVEGYPHMGADTDPRLAWQEGWATFFSALALEGPVYMDSVGDDVYYVVDLSALPVGGEFVAQSSEPVTQTLSEWLVAGSLWAILSGSSDVAAQRQRSASVVRDWLSWDPPNDRGIDGADLVDFLDGYLCLNGGVDREVIESYVVDEREFPYDLSPPCGAGGAGARRAFVRDRGKPGRPRLASPHVIAADGLFRGDLVASPRGERLRQTRVAAVVRPGHR
jgi:hypothetical protein